VRNNRLNQAFLAGRERLRRWLIKSLSLDRHSWLALVDPPNYHRSADCFFF